jgi:hypothetical protein
MAVFGDPLTTSHVSGADLSALQYRLVKISAADKVAAADAVTNPQGVLQNDPKSGAAASVAFSGRCLAVAGGAISAGDFVKWGTGGKCLTASPISSGDMILGRAINAAASDGAEFDLLLKPEVVLFPSTSVVKYLQVGTNTTILIFKASQNVRILNVEFIVNTGVAKDGANFWTFQVHNITKTQDLLSAVKTTEDIAAGVAITANVPYQVTPDQNQNIDSGDVLQLICTDSAAAANLEDLTIIVTVALRV